MSHNGGWPRKWWCPCIRTLILSIKGRPGDEAMWKNANVPMLSEKASYKSTCFAPQKIKYRITIWAINYTSGYICKRIQSKDPNRYLYIHVQSGIIHDNPTVEATQVFTDRWLDKQNVVHPYNGILFSPKKEGDPDTCCNVDESRGYYAKWNKPVTKGQILCNST